MFTYGQQSSAAVQVLLRQTLTEMQIIGLNINHTFTHVNTENMSTNTQ